MGQECIELLVVGGHQLHAEALGVALGADPYLNLVGIHTDSDLAIDYARQTRPDVALLDYSAPHLGAAQLIATLREALPALRMIVLAESIDEDTLAAFVQAGAAGYLTKDCSLAKLVHSIKQVHRGQVLFAPDELVHLLTGRAGQHAIQLLAPREAEVLQIMATGMSTKEAAARLGISMHTLRTHLKRVMTKLGVHSTLEAVIFALKKGLIQLPE